MKNKVQVLILLALAGVFLGTFSTLFAMPTSEYTSIYTRNLVVECDSTPQRYGMFSGLAASVIIEKNGHMRLRPPAGSKNSDELVILFGEGCTIEVDSQMVDLSTNPDLGLPSHRTLVPRGEDADHKSMEKLLMVRCDGIPEGMLTERVIVLEESQIALSYPSWGRIPNRSQCEVSLFLDPGTDSSPSL